MLPELHFFNHCNKEMFFHKCVSFGFFANKEQNPCKIKSTISIFKVADDTWPRFRKHCGVSFAFLSLTLTFETNRVGLWMQKAPVSVY